MDYILRFGAESLAEFRNFCSVALETPQLYLATGSTKNDAGRVVYPTPELTELLTPRSSVCRRSAASWSGWTRAVFDRYHIVSPGDLQDRLGGWQPVSAAAPVTAGQVTPLR
jgi:hypothetical protein